MNKEQFNIILIICDTLSANHMSIYGYNRDTTPYLSRLLESDDFVLYKYCFSTSSWTLPAHASLFTGLYPSDHGVTGETFDACILSNELVTLPQLLKLKEYFCFGISSNPIISKITNFSIGFDGFISLNHEFRITTNNISLHSTFSRSYLLRKIIDILKAKRTSILFSKSQNIYNCLYAMLFLDKNVTFFSYYYSKLALYSFFSVVKHKKRLPFFCFINLMENHDKYIPPVKFRRKFCNYSFEQLYNQKWWKHYYDGQIVNSDIPNYISFYDEEVLTVDYLLYSFLEKLKSFYPHIYDRTLIIITADHGEALGEWNHWGHMFSVYPEVTRIPLLVKFPKGYECNKKTDSLIQLNDLFATILNLVDQDFPVPESSISIFSSEKRKKAIVENYWSKFNNQQHAIKKEHFFAKIIEKDNGMFEYIVEEKLKNKIKRYETRDFFKLVPVQEDKNV